MAIKNGIVTIRAYFIQNNEQACAHREFKVSADDLGPVTQFWLLPLVDEAGKRIDSHSILNMGFVLYVEIDEPKPALAS
jgi:hypothetical protein